MFWGLVLEPSKKYTQKVDQTFHISQAALDLKSCDSEPIQLVVEYENSNFVLATLSKKANIFQVPLDLIFKTGDQVSFRTIGNGKVHLSGYHVLEDLDSVIMNGEEESEVEEVEEMDESTKGKGKRKKPAINFKGKKARLEDLNEDESDEEDDDDDDDEDEDMDDEEDEDSENENVPAGKKAEKKNQKLNSLLSSMDEGEDDDDDDDDDEDEDEDDDDDDDDDDDEDEDDDFEAGELDDLSLELDKKNKKGLQTPNGVESGPKGKDKSAQKLNKSLNSKTPKNEVKTPKSEKKNEKKAANTESTPQKKNPESQKKEEKTPKSPKPEGSPQKKVLEGGVISEEIKVGNGPVAKPGKMANVYYVGTLASTKKEFDSVQSGAGFKFRVGRNEVIKGWDIGIVGMKVGGKRRLTIPPHLAYGSKGSPPVIPPNSTLVFNVELRSLS